MTSQKRSSAKNLTVGELIKCLQKLDQALPVFYVMFDDGYNIQRLTEQDIIAQTLETDKGKEFPALVLGEEWLG